MSQIKEVETLDIGKGCVLRLYVDFSKPEDSIDRQWGESYYDGAADSQLFKVPAHWHKHHDELMTLLEGKLEIMIDGKTEVVEADPEKVIRIPRWHVHSITGIKGQPMKLKERTDPTGEFKRDFFVDLTSGGYPGTFLHTMRAFYDGDTYPSLPGGIKVVDQAFVYVLGSIAKMILPARTVGKPQ